jgi:hypothetical protein
MSSDFISKQEYNQIQWVSNYSIDKKKTFTYGGIIGFNVKDGKIKHISEILFRPAYLGPYKYLTANVKKNSVVLVTADSREGPIVGKKLNTKQKDLIRETSFESVLKHTMPPILQSAGGPLMPTVVDEELLFREWGYYLGTISKIKEYSQLADRKIRFSPYLFILSSYISEYDIIIYLSGCKYYGMTLPEIKQELLLVFQGEKKESLLYKQIIEIMENLFKDELQTQMNYIPEFKEAIFRKKRVSEKKPNNEIINKSTGQLFINNFTTNELSNTNQFSKIFQLSDNDIIDVIDNESYEYYPPISDKNFECTLCSKNEFYKLKQESVLDKTIEELCPIKSFPKLKSQELVRNFMRPETPYAGLLVYHGLGTGKTCLSIQVAETFKPLVKKLGKKILVIVSRSIYENYLKELYNFSKEPIEKKYNLPKGTLQCTGNEYAPPDFLTFEDRVKYRNQGIKKFYEIITYSGIKKIFFDIARYFFPQLRMKTFGYKQALACCNDEAFLFELNNIFSDRLFIIDEVHNMRESTNEDEKISSKILELILQFSQRIKLLLLTATPIYNQSSEIIYILNLLRLNDKETTINENFFAKTKFLEGKESVFKNLWKGRVSYVRGENPINFPEKIYPSDDLIYVPKWEKSYDGKSKVKNILLQFLPAPLVLARMSNYQKQIYYRNKTAETNVNNADANIEESFHLTRKLISNIVFPTNNTDETTKMYGPAGMKKCFEYEGSRKTKGPFVPKTTAYVDQLFFLDERVVSNFSPKLAIIWNEIKTNPNHLIFVFSEYLEGGVLPLCLLLEYHGFSRYDDNNLLNIRTKNNILNNKYILLDGSIPSEKRNKWVQKFNDSNNKNGETIQVIIGTRVMSEGIDLKNVRQIHILNPWFNMSRIDQIIGRGVRHCSHLAFSKKQDRTVKIFLYAASLFDKTLDLAAQETTDEYIYRMATEKDILFQRIFKSLKEVAFDCNLNYLNNVFPGIDKDYSRECAYEKCNLKCDPICKFTSINYDTYYPYLTMNSFDQLENKVIDVLKNNKKAFTLRELVLFVFQNNLSESDIEILKYVIKKLIQENRILYKGNQYLYIPDKYYNYSKMGLEYILYSNQLLPSRSKLNLPPNVYTMLSSRSDGPVEDLSKINEYSIQEWADDITKRIDSYRRIFSSIERYFEFDNIILRFFMNEYPYHTIIYYLKNACLENLIDQFENAFGYILVDREKVRFLDLAKDSLNKITIYQKASRLFENGNNVKENIFMKDYEKKRDKIPVLNDLSTEAINLNDIYGYIQYNEKKKIYIFKIVNKNLEKKRNKASKTIKLSGENCSTWAIESKRSMLLTIINKYLESKNTTFIPNEYYKKLRSIDLCVLIQFFLLKNQSVYPDKLFLFELRN